MVVAPTSWNRHVMAALAGAAVLAVALAAHPAGAQGTIRAADGPTIRAQEPGFFDDPFGSLAGAFNSAFEAAFPITSQAVSWIRRQTTGAGSTEPPPPPEPSEIEAFRSVLAELVREAEAARKACDRLRYERVLAHYENLLSDVRAQSTAWAAQVNALRRALVDAARDVARAGADDVAAALDTLGAGGSADAILYKFRTAAALVRGQVKGAATPAVRGLGNALLRAEGYALNAIGLESWAGLYADAEAALKRLRESAPNCVKPQERPVTGDAAKWQEASKLTKLADGIGREVPTTILVIPQPESGTPSIAEPDRPVRLPQPGDNFVITAQCHLPLVYVVGEDEPPAEGTVIPQKPLGVLYECDMDPAEVERAAAAAAGAGVRWSAADTTTSRVEGLSSIGGNICSLQIPIYLPIGEQCPNDGSGVPSETALPPGTPEISALPTIVGDGILGWDNWRAIQTELPPGTELAQGGVTLTLPGTDPTGYGPVPDDPLFGSSGSWGQSYDDQWGLKRIGFRAASADGDPVWPKRAEPVIVAVIDSGLDLSHPELAGRVWFNPREIPFNGKDDDGNGLVDDFRGWNFADDNGDVTDLNGHGTFVAGVIAAGVHNGLGIAGVNPWARIMPLKVTTVDGNTRSSLIARAVAYAIDNGARVINISLGGKGVTRIEQAAFDAARAKGVVVVVAAGNVGADTATFGPGGADGIVTVAATDTQDVRVGFSNWGAEVDVAAPGVDILSLRAARTDLLLLERKDYRAGSAFVGADRNYYRTSGTSFSAPLVAGVASLILSTRPGLNGAQVERMILQSARDVGTPGRDQYTGYGLVDAAAAMRADPAFFVEASIEGVAAAQAGGGVVVRVTGDALADRFGKAWLEIGKGEDPGEWRKVGDELRRAVENGALGDIPASLLGGARQWTIRLVVEHAGGTRREARFLLTLG